MLYQNLVLLLLQLLTSCVVGCLRVKMNWSLSSIIQEFENQCEPEGGLHDIQFIENFKMSFDDTSYLS